MGTLKTTNIQTITGSGTLTLGTSGETLTVPTGVTTTLTDGVSGDLKFNSGYGSVATAYGCRAWVNFNGTGTVAIRDSGNVSSITDLNTGRYSVNFTTAMPDINYSAVGTSLGSVNASYATYLNSNGSALTTTGFEVQNRNSVSDSIIDIECICVAVFR